MKNADLSQANQILRVDLFKRVSIEQRRKLLELGRLSNIFDAEMNQEFDRDAFRKIIGLEEIHEASPIIIHFPIELNNKLSIEKMIENGNYIWHDERINSKNFSVTQKGIIKTEIILVNFNCWLPIEDVLAELNKLGLQPAKLMELLTIGLSWPECLQQKSYTVALGSELQDMEKNEVFVPFIKCIGNNNKFFLSLELEWFPAWNEKTWFAAVCK